MTLSGAGTGATGPRSARNVGEGPVLSRAPSNPGAHKGLPYKAPSPGGRLGFRAGTQTTEAVVPPRPYKTGRVSLPALRFDSVGGEE